MMESRWYVIRTLSRADAFVANEMNRNGFEVFCPQVKSIDANRKQVETPLFPGYLFLKLDVEDGQPPQFPKTNRVIGWLTFGNDIAWLSDQVVDEIKIRSEIINREGGSLRRFQVGDLVRIVSSAFDDTAEVIESPKADQEKVKVLLEFMGRSVPAQVSRFDLQPIDSQSWSKFRTARRTRGKGRWIRNAGQKPLTRV